MAANKEKIQTKVSTIDDGGLNSAEELREVFATHPDSFLEAIYGNEIFETQETSQIFTSLGFQYTYSLNIQKIGRLVSINGYVTATGVNQASVVAEITNPDFKIKEGGRYYACGTINGFTPELSFGGTTRSRLVRIYDSVNGNIFLECRGLKENESVAFSMMYSSKD